jgi:hypothetical protein
MRQLTARDSFHLTTGETEKQQRLERKENRK